MKRFSKLLCIIMVFSMLLSACGNSSNKKANTDTETSTKKNNSTKETKEGSKSNTDGKIELNKLGELPLVNEIVELEVFAPQPSYITDMKTNKFTKWYEEQTNVHLKWNVAPENALQEKKSLLLASGDYPDIFMHAGITQDDLMMYGGQGAFLALNDILEENTIELKKIFKQKTGLKKQMTAIDGNMYYFPAFNECYHCMHAKRAWINTDWLKAVGMEMPTTTEEFKKVLKAFKDQDPNGNGMQDEIPLSGAIDGWESKVPDFFINSFIYSNGGDRLYLDNGKVETNFDKPEFKEALSYLNDLYSEELIDPAAFTQDQTQLKQLGSNPDKEVLGVATSALWWSFIEESDNGKERAKIYRALPPLEGPNGVRYAGYFAPNPIIEIVVSSQCKYPELAVRWADNMLKTDVTLRCGYGVKDENWAEPEDGAKGINGKPAVWKKIITERKPQHNNHWANIGAMNRSNDFRLGQQSDPDDIWDKETRLYNVSHDIYNPCIPEQDMILPNLSMTGDEVGEYARLKTTINDYVEEAISRFIIGDLNIENDWDNYVKELNSLGLQDYLDMIQKAYDRQYK